MSEYNAQQTAPPTVAQRSSKLFPFQATALVGMGEGRKAYLASLLGCPISYLATTDSNSCVLLARWALFLIPSPSSFAATPGLLHSKTPRGFLTPSQHTPPSLQQRLEKRLFFLFKIKKISRGEDFFILLHSFAKGCLTSGGPKLSTLPVPSGNS